MVYLYGPQDASFMKGGVITLVHETPGVTLTGGTNVTVGADDAYLVDGSTGFITNMFVYMDGALTTTDLPTPQVSTVPWSFTEALPGTGSHQYGFRIWTGFNWNGIGYHNLYLTDAGGATPSVMCAYGTQQKDPSLSVVDIGAAIITSVLQGRDPRWAIALLAGYLGRHIFLSDLCSRLPPPDEDLVPGDFVPSGVTDPFPRVTRKLDIKITRMLWDQYCECKPATGGGSPPVGPGPTNITQPTWYVTNNTYNITNNDIANTLNIYLNLQNAQTHIDNQLAAAAAAPTRCSPEAFEEGIVHEGLVGEGRFTISEAIGFKVEITERPGAGIILSGQPNYLWNMGWISTLADELLLEEKRVTRDGYYWFPCSMQFATEFTFTLRDFVELRVTELVKPAQIVLAA